MCAQNELSLAAGLIEFASDIRRKGRSFDKRVSGITPQGGKSNRALNFVAQPQPVFRRLYGSSAGTSRYAMANIYIGIVIIFT